MGWWHYAQKNGPFNWRRGDWQTAMLLKMQSGNSDSEVADFRPKFVSSEEEDWDDAETVEKELAKTMDVFKQITLAMGGEWKE